MTLHRHFLRAACVLGVVVLASGLSAHTLAANAAAQTVVVGTGNPDVDVPAVQAAVDRGGEVILKGHFSFRRDPAVTIPTALLPWGYPQKATILVSKAVAISGTLDGNEEIATIEGGTTPFYVEAPGARVTIQGLRFIDPKAGAILVYAVDGLTIASCKIDGVAVFDHFGYGIAIDTRGGIPSPAQSGKPENISGTLLIVNNDIDLAGAGASDATDGVYVFSAGVPGAEVDAYVSGNRITNSTGEAIMFRRVAGRVYVDRNAIVTAPVATTLSSQIDVIRVVNTGSYLIAHNSIDCRLPQTGGPTVLGIGVLSQFAEWPMDRAIVVDNDVTMSPPRGTAVGPDSAGINIRGFSEGNVVLNNRIRGRATVAISVNVYQKGIPGSNAFVLNRFDDFEASVADIFVSEGVVNTRVAGLGTVEDQGIGTQIVRLPFSPDRLDDVDASSADTFMGEGVTDPLLLGQEGTIEDHGVSTVIVPVREDDDPGTETAETATRSDI